MHKGSRHGSPTPRGTLSRRPCHDHLDIVVLAEMFEALDVQTGLAHMLQRQVIGDRRAHEPRDHGTQHPHQGTRFPGFLCDVLQEQDFPLPLDDSPQFPKSPDRVGNGTEDERGDDGVKDAFAKLEGLYISQVELDGKAQPPGPLPGRVAGLSCPLSGIAA